MMNNFLDLGRTAAWALLLLPAWVLPFAFFDYLLALACAASLLISVHAIIQHAGDDLPMTILVELSDENGERDVSFLYDSSVELTLVLATVLSVTLGLSLEFMLWPLPFLAAIAREAHMSRIRDAIDIARAMKARNGLFLP